MVRALALAAVVTALAPAAARAEEAAPSSTSPLASPAAPSAPAEAVAPAAPRELIGELTWKKAGLFAGGFVTAFALHESGHLITGLSLGVHPRIAPVWFLGFIPFFAIDSRISCGPDICTTNNQPFDAGPRGAAVIFSAGFQIQHITDELLLSLDPGLRDQDAPFRKGMLAFNIATSLGYAIADWIGVEPISGDVASMNRFTHVPRALNTGLLFGIAGLDAARFLFPESRVLPWVSRAAKVAFLGEVLVF